MTRIFLGFPVDDRIVGPEPDEQAALKPVFAAIVASLESHGIAIATPLQEWDAYGWYVEVDRPPARLTCMLQQSDCWLLMLWAERTILDRLRGRTHEAELLEFARIASLAVAKAFGVSPPAVQTEAEFRAAGRAT